MPDLQEQMNARKRELRELTRSRSKAPCSAIVSSGIDVRRETRIEELEEEIRELRKKMKPR